MQRSKPKTPDDNHSLRRAFSDMVRARMDGLDPFEGKGRGPHGYAAFFQTRYGVNEAEAAHLAIRLHKTMVDSNGS